MDAAAEGRRDVRGDPHAPGSRAPGGRERTGRGPERTGRGAGRDRPGCGHSQCGESREHVDLGCRRTINGYRIDRPAGILSVIGHTSQGVSGPTNFVIDPSGRWLYVNNSTADSVAQFAVL
jgi:hypothetical protein